MVQTIIMVKIFKRNMRGKKYSKNPRIVNFQNICKMLFDYLGNPEILYGSAEGLES